MSEANPKFLEDYPANPAEKENYILEFNEEFQTPVLDIKKWIPYYLPQWSSRELSKPNYHFHNGNLVLKITKDQQPWCPEFNGDVKCSSIQTGVFSGKLGSKKGQHRFNTLCEVREEQTNIKKYTPQYGFFEIRAKALDTESNVVALWMIGYEDKPEKSSEICIFEIKGENVNKESAIIGYGIRPFGDPTLQDEFHEDSFAIDVTKYHVYAVEWTPAYVDFYIDNKKVRTIHQSPNYPMQLMLNIYELPIEKVRIGKDNQYPKEFTIDYIRVFQPEKGY
ncbi:Glycosyl hydrolases family 16 [compost metagenome]